MEMGMMGNHGMGGMGMGGMGMGMGMMGGMGGGMGPMPTLESGRVILALPDPSVSSGGSLCVCALLLLLLCRGFHVAP